MNITDLIQGAVASRTTRFAFELLPPLKGDGTRSVFGAIDPLMDFNPAYINVTFHREALKEDIRPDGSREWHIMRRRPGTVGISAAIRRKYDVEVVPHLICGGWSKYDIEDSLILPGDVETACLTERERIGRPVLGVDVARFGADRSVVYLCVNGVVRFVDSWAKTDLVHSAQRVHDLALREGAHAVAIDCDGIGGGMFDILNSYANRTYDILAVRGSMSSPDRGRWHNYRSYMWDSFRYRFASLRATT